MLILGYTMKSITILANLIFLLISSSAWSFQLGINAHIWNLSDNDWNKSLKLVSAMNFKMIRLDVPWKIVEAKKGNYSVPDVWDKTIDYAVQNGIEPVLILDYGNPFYENGNKPRTKESIAAFGQYAKFIVTHYKNKVKYIQIWNEWDAGNSGTTPGTVDDYKNLVRSTYTIIKNANPDSIVITGAFSSAAFNKHLGIGAENYFEDYVTPDMASYTDVIAIHPYTTYREKPYNNYWAYLSQVQYSKHILNSTAGYKNKPLFITEIGWSTSLTKDSISESMQAEYLLRAICDAKKLGVSAVMLYDLRDDFPFLDRTASGFGFFKYNWGPKEAVEKLSQKLCD